MRESRERETAARSRYDTRESERSAREGKRSAREGRNVRGWRATTLSFSRERSPLDEGSEKIEKQMETLLETVFRSN